VSAVLTLVDVKPSIHQLVMRHHRKPSSKSVKMCKGCVTTRGVAVKVELTVIIDIFM
jgi:hypothetical protein